jgi:hypothetical protein
VMTQKTFERIRRIELQLGVAPSHYEPGTPAAARRATDEIGARPAQAGPPGDQPEDGRGQAQRPGEAVRL